jgi:hypothetical protein
MAKGIINSSGFSCHLASALQLIYHCLPSLRQALIGLSGLPLLESPLLRNFARLFAELQRNDDDEPVDPSALYSALRNQKSVESNDLGDSVRILRTLLATIRCEMVKLARSSACFKTLIKILENELDGTMEQILTGRKRSVQRCKVKLCAQASPFPVPVAPSLAAGIDKATIQPQEITGYSWENVEGYDELEVEDSALEYWKTSKTIVFQSIPETLLLHLQRFSLIDGQVQLLANQMDIPYKLEMNKYCLEQSLQREYVLKGGLLHVSDSHKASEDEEAGHYIAIVRLDGRWIILDDEDSTEMSYSEQDILDFLSCRKSSIIQLNSGSSVCPTLLVYTASQEGGKSSAALLSTFSEQLADKLKKQDEEQNWDFSIIGRRVNILWAKGNYYPGTIIAYNEIEGKHKIEYDDGDIKIYNLRNKVIEWI